MRTIVLATLVWACSSPKPSSETAPPAPPAQHAGSGTAIDLPGDANGLYWDEREHALYLADDTHDTLVKWTDAGGFSVVGPLTAPGGKVAFGGITRLADGRFAIASFGFGTDGGVIIVDANHVVTEVPALARTRRRIGISAAPDGTLYDVFFVAGKGTRGGGLAVIDPATGETDVVTTLQKPIGVVATATGVFVSDQDAGAIYQLRDKQLVAIATGLPSTDLLAALPDGSLVTGGKSGSVERVKLDGSHMTIASGYQQVRGIAYDATGKRLFVVEHSRATSNHELHVVPFAP